MKMTSKKEMNRRVETLVAAMILALGLSGQRAEAQAPPSATKPDPTVVQTFYFTNTSQPNDPNEISVAIRNLLPADIRAILVPGENALSVRGTPDQLVLVQKLLNDLDRPKKAYRLTYTLTETDSGKRSGVQHFAMIVVTGGRTTLKNGSKVPIVTGASAPGTSAQNTQVSYIDIGLNIDASLDELANGARLRTKVEQSSVAEERSSVGTQDPVVRQTVFEGTSFLSPGKPLVVGSVDISGSTRHLDIEVVMEAAR